MSILDLGLGSGALLAALLRELPNAFGVGVERSHLAAMRARGNLGRLGLLGRAGVVVADWHAPLDGAFDLIVSNPPYIATKEIGLLEPEVRSHDPMLALDGGDDGFAAYRKIIPAARCMLRADGFVCLECGSGQAAEISKMLEAARLTSIATRRDLAGIERVVMARAAA